MSAPRLITRRDKIRGVAARWRKQYRSGTTLSRGESADAIYTRLSQLDPESAVRGDVDAIIGNTNWTAIQCDGCGRDVEAAVEVGAEPDYDSPTAVLCADCIAAALHLVAGGVRGPAQP
jgi:hypothetical protein